MNKSYQYLNIDINKKIYRRLNAVQGDTKSRYILVSLYNNSIAFDLSNCSVKVFGVKSDKKIFFNYANIIDASKGQFEIELTSQALAVNGELQIQILVLGANQERLTTCTFFIDVDRTIVDDNAIQSENEFTALTKGLADLAEYDTYKNNVLKHDENLIKHEDKLNEVSSQLAHNENEISVIKAEKVNVTLFGAIGDGLNDDTQAIKNSIDEAIKKGIRKVFLPSGIYRITSSIIINSPIQIIGNGTGETCSPTVILKDGNFDGIIIYSRDVVLENFTIKGDKNVDESDGIVIGESGYNAQSCVIRNVLATNNGGDGIKLRQCNNGVFDNIITLYNGGSGFSMNPSSESNYSGNIINVTNSYGNGDCGVVLSGEGNKFYICAQSNTNDNIRLSGWCTNCDIMGYTEFAVNGYEINANGNVFANTIKGVYRSKTNKVYTSVTGLTNNLSFSQDLQNSDNGMVSINDKTTAIEFHFLKGLTGTPFASNGYLRYDNGLQFVDSNETPNLIAYTSHEKIMFNNTVCTSTSSTGTVFLNDSNGDFDTTYQIFEDGVIYGITTKLKEPIQSDILQIFIYKNNAEVSNAWLMYNSTADTYLEKKLNIKVSKGDKISIKTVWYSNSKPLNNKLKAVLYKK